VTLLLLFVGFALGVSFLCSLLEATLLASRNATLAEKATAGSRGSQLLLEIKQHRADDAISSILILNTVSNTLGATLAGAQAAKIFGSTWIGAFSGVLTLLILVFSEIIPKTLGAYYWRNFCGFAGRVLSILIQIAAPALVVSRLLTRLLTRGRSYRMSRGELVHVVSTASSQGTISDDESEMVRNLLRFSDVRVEDVMTPRTVTYMVSADTTVDSLLKDGKSEAFSRIPIFDRSRDDVVGYVLMRDVLKAASDGGDRTLPVRRYKREILFIPEIATIDAALRQILERREPIAMAVDEHGGIAGLVTLEDLAETILGVEIVDEFDLVVDLRREAARLRDQRMERMRRRQTEGG
jgi:CBS domain containing-hemolysin-like protein